MERFIAQAVSLAVSIILARLLTPDDYSIVGIVVIFFNFANVIISGGLNTALIQKKDADKEDYSTVLYISIIVSVVLYGLLFVTAPFIAGLYEKPLLVPIIRIMSLSLPIYAVKSVVCAYISSNLQFRKFFFATIVGTVISAVIGIYMALNGFGAWALVAQQMTNTVIDTVILLATTRLPLVLKISISRFKVLFGYGWKVFVSSLLNTAYSETVPAFIGIKFTTADLSFYTKGKNFPTLLSSTTTNTLSAVLFPVMAKYQDDKAALLNYTRRFIKLASYISFPLMLGFFAVSDNFVSVLLTDKWMPASFYIKIFCITSMFEMIHIGNCETIKAMGRSDIFLIMEIIKKSSYFIIIALFLWLGSSPESLAISAVICTAVAIVVNSIPNRKLIDYRFRQQIFDLVPNLLTAAVMCIAVLLVGRLAINKLLLLALQIATGLIVYVVLSLSTKNDSFYYILNLLKSYIKKDA